MNIVFRKPRQARNGWFYLNPRSIEIYRDADAKGPVRITLKQLRAAIKAMTTKSEGAEHANKS